MFELVKKLLSGVVKLGIRSSKHKLDNTVNELVANTTSINPNNDPKLIDSKAKGDEFENFIVSKFDRSAFELTFWRSDKYHDGRYPTSNKLPDMEWKLISLYAKVSFAVECKYRSNYLNNAVEIAKEYQLNNYRAFSKEKRQPVFIVLGIGGQPSAPAELFIIPLKEIVSNTFTAPQLKRYSKKKVDGTFFFDVTQKMLL